MKTFPNLLWMILFVPFIIHSQSVVPLTENNISKPYHPELKTATTPTLVTDTLEYFYNKQFFKSVSGLDYYRAYSATYTNTKVTYVGSVFLNDDPNLVINGVTARVALHNSLNGLSLPIKIYLCNVDANLLPILPGLDSLTFQVTGAQSPTVAPTHLVGGIFGGTGSPSPKNVSGNFAVLVRNASTIGADTVRLFRTSALTPTNTNSTPYNRMGEGLGVVRFGGNWYKTTNYVHPGFGSGTDYEFCVAPIVTYNLEASQIAPLQVNSQPVDSVLCGHPLTFTNTSSPEFSSRFFNLNEFYRHFYPYANTPPFGFSTDSAISWYFDDEDSSGNPPNIVLKANQETASKVYDTSGCFTNCELRARLRKMTGGGSSVKYNGTVQFSVCVANCAGVGIKENLGLEPVKVFPNPMVNSSLSITGLKGSNVIYIYTMFGQMVFSRSTSQDHLDVDLFKISRGNYILKIIDEKGYYKSFRLVQTGD